MHIYSLLGKCFMQNDAYTLESLCKKMEIYVYAYINMSFCYAILKSLLQHVKLDLNL